MKLYHFALLLTFFACIHLKEGQASCPQNWLSFEKKCIFISNEEDKFNNVALFCHWRGGELASLSSLETWEFLTLHLKGVQGKNFWVGIYSNTANDSYRWIDNTEASVHLSQVNSSETEESNCFVYNGEVVEAGNCSSLNKYICSKDKPLFNPVENCLVGRTEHSFVGEVSGNCVYRTPDATKRDNVDAKCGETGGRFLDLDEIAKEGLRAFRDHKVMTNDGFKYWTALTYNNTSLYWKSGLLFTSYSIPVELGNGSCVTVSFNYTTSIEVRLYQTECEDHAHVICAVPRATTTIATPLTSQETKVCPQGLNWKTFRATGDCYWETSFETSRLSWDDARTYCQAYGGDLASFHSVDEERIGLSFQYGSLAHPYWIGLRLDVESETYKWVDGTPLDYENWAPGHPNHLDKRLRCVAMNASSKNWISSLCGIISWFVCKAPKQVNPLPPVLPARPVLPACGPERTFVPKRFYFKGYCYEVINLRASWHRAKEYCENKGSSLVSMHSDDEIGFVLRLLYDDKHTVGNRFWIGLNSLSGPFKWTDYSPVDLTYWNKDEPNNYLNQEKCVNMHMGSGLWNDENCFSDMGFICKENINATDAPEIPTTVDPLIGNCKKGWYPHHDRCYLLVGIAEKDRVNWTMANSICGTLGGYLVSIRNAEEQVFLSYLLQGLKGDAWIGLHDTIQSGRYFWIDNSNIRYTNWAVGEPSFFGIQEDCVKMLYDDVDSGVWQDDVCGKELGFICHSEKDPNLPPPTYNRGINCIYPEGWLKLEDMCFKMYAGNDLTWADAEAACLKDGGHLISVSGPAIQTVATYLGTEVNQSFWIGLLYQESKQQFEWINGWIMTFSKWGRGALSITSREDSCFASDKYGYWSRFPCNEEMPYICQISSGKGPQPKLYTGDCPKGSNDWLPTDGNYCHLIGKEKVDWFTALLRCFSQGSTLMSLHSLEEVEMVKEVLKRSPLDNMPSVYIGLLKNEKGGFYWSDHTPVDFVNWLDGQPENDEGSCVIMFTSNFKWAVVPCSSNTNYICSYPKDQEVDGIPENAKYGGDASAGLSIGALSGIIVCLVLAIIIIMAGVLYFRPPLGKTRFRIPFRHHSMSFENALYNADSASMEFQDDRKDSCDST